MEMNKEDAQEMLEQIIQLNLLIAKQNSLIVQALTLPSLMVKAEKND